MAPTDRETALQADSEWLQALSDALHDVEYAALLHYLSRQPLDPEMMARGITAEKMASMFSFDGNTMLSGIVRLAMQNLDLNKYPCNPTDLLFLYTAIPTLNGFCLKTPNLGNPAVVLNHGLVGYIANATHLILGLTRWTDGEYCKHYPPETILQGLFQLAEGVHDKKPAMLINIEAASCLGYQEHAPTEVFYETTCLLGELFIVFHELGHIALGHLNQDDVTYAFGDEVGPNIPVFNRSQYHELEADNFAFRQLIDVFVKRGGLPERHIAYGVGCLFMLFRAVEAFSPRWINETHPPSVIRWRTLKAELTEPRAPAAFNSIDYFFEWIENLSLK